MTKPRHFLDLDRLDTDTLRGILDQAVARKAGRAGLDRGVIDSDRPLEGRILAMIFEKPSTRTRVSFDVAMRQLGGQTIEMNGAEMQMGRGESVADTARVLSRYVDAIMIRTDRHDLLLQLAEHASVPVINGLTGRTHPCQVMADIMTFEEHRGAIADRRVAWSGDGNNVAVSWMHASSRDVREVLVDTPNGPKIPMKVLARISEERGPNLIMRENAQRRIIVQCNVAERDLGSVVDDIRRAVAEQVELPQGYYVEYGGQFESAEQTRRRLAILGLVVILGIAFLLHVVFRSVRDAALIMLNLPLALIGGVVGVHLSGGVLSVASLIGFIGVFGIAARNGIMMVSHIRHLQRFEGVTDFTEAVRRGAMERLAPILMTALCAGLALIPLTLGGDQPGKEILSPMAMVILFGLLSSTFLNMIVVPALFVRFARPVESESPV